MATIHRPTWQCWREKTPDNVSCCRAIVQFQRENSGNAGEKDSSDAREKDSSNSREKNSPSPCIAMKKCNHHLIVSCYYLFSSISLPLAIITNNTTRCHQHQLNTNPANTTSTTTLPLHLALQDVSFFFPSSAMPWYNTCWHQLVTNPNINRIPTPAMLQLSMSANKLFFIFTLA